MENNMRLMFLGDIHGMFNIIQDYIKRYNIKDAHIIQVGDFGVGFKDIKKEKKTLGYLNDSLYKRNVFLWVIRGNHDNPEYFRNDPFGLSNIKLLADYTVLNLADKNILFVGGAVSVDRMYIMTKNQKDGDFITDLGNRKWWHDELFNYKLDKIKDLRNIDIVVTHTCPDYCPPDNTFGLSQFVNDIIKDTGDENLKTDIMFERYQMKDLFTVLKMNNDITNHYYGHFHRSDCINMYGTNHRLLNINELWEER